MMSDAPKSPQHWIYRVPNHAALNTNLRASFAQGCADPSIRRSGTSLGVLIADTMQSDEFVIGIVAQLEQPINALMADDAL